MFDCLPQRVRVRLCLAEIVAKKKKDGLAAGMSCVNRPRGKNATGFFANVEKGCPMTYSTDRVLAEWNICMQCKISS